MFANIAYARNVMPVLPVKQAMAKTGDYHAGSCLAWVGDIARSRAFYDAVLRPLGLVRIVDFRGNKGADYGAAPGSTGVEFTITEETGAVVPSRGSHLCFRAGDRGAVDAFRRGSACRRRP